VITSHFSCDDVIELSLLFAFLLVKLALLLGGSVLILK
jgi:hypothetical protein